MKSNKIFKYVLFSELRSKMFLFYLILFLILGFAIFYLGKDVSKSLITITNIILLVVPMFSIISGSIHYYNSREFNEMLLTQPIKRSAIFFGQYLGISCSMALAFTIGLGIPLFLFAAGLTTFLILLSGISLTFCFTAIAFLISIKNNDKAKGIGMSIISWFYFSVLYDGLILLFLFLFSDYPLEKTLLILTALNPIDTVRIIILMQLDISALLGITGALYQDVFGTMTGLIAAFSITSLWIFAPLIFAYKRFRKKDF
ncbi:MAG: ABC transporter permease [Bacteroidia bacterium]|nr:ABC transporter permease [Bacteroidia bacterium]